MKLTEETLMVQPINEDKVLELILKEFPAEEREIIRINVGAITYDSIEVDQECCYGFMNRKFVNGKIQLVLEVPVMVDTKTETGRYMAMSPKFHFDINEENLEEYLLPKISLKEFMGSRYNYNPRIKSNTRAFVSEINEIIKSATVAEEN